MSIEFSHTIEVSRSPAEVFAFVDDLGKTPSWLERCTGIEKLTSGENAVGTKLRYSYADGGRKGQMDGEITHRVPGEHLSFEYRDKMMAVTVDFRMAKSDAGTRLTHTVDIRPQTFMSKLFSPMIRRALPTQTMTAMEKLRGLLEQK